LLALAGSALLAAPIVVATAPSDKPQTWTSPIVIGFLVAGGVLLALALWMLGFSSPFARGVARLLRATGNYLPRVRVSAPKKRLPVRFTLTGVRLRESSRFVVVSATYATSARDPQKSADVKDILNSRIADGRVDFVVDNTFLGGDPAPEEPKVLFVSWKVGREIFHSSYLEGTHVVLP
jgi:hypothetical protein